FFKHESSFGLLGIARQTRSLGNIRCSRGYQCIAGYRAYPSWVGGYLDWYNLIYSYYIKQLHRHTVSAILPLYAPPSDGNNVTAYVAAVTQAVAQWRKASA
nr:hypothetical protein [Chloroflexota bacterium]